PDVALVDIGMPGMDGYETARRWRELTNGQQRRTRLVALTGYAQPHDVDRALASGFDEHLAKPARPDALREVLQRPEQARPD
ncbi:MAG: response regulator, partial [Acidobacteriota bacterium]